MKSINIKMFDRILQGLGVGPGSATERWPCRKKNENNQKKIFLKIFLLVMPKYWGKQIFTHGSFPKVGEKKKADEEKK